MRSPTPPVGTRTPLMGTPTDPHGGTHGPYGAPTTPWRFPAPRPHGALKGRHRPPKGPPQVPPSHSPPMGSHPTPEDAATCMRPPLSTPHAPRGPHPCQWVLTPWDLPPHRPICGVPGEPQPKPHSRGGVWDGPPPGQPCPPPAPGVTPVHCGKLPITNTGRWAVGFGGLRPPGLTVDQAGHPVPVPGGWGTPLGARGGPVAGGRPGAQ